MAANYMGDMPTVTGKTTQIAIRLDHDLAERIDALVQKLSPPGMYLARSEVLRSAIAKGVEALEAANGIKPAKKSVKK